MADKPKRAVSSTQLSSLHFWAVSVLLITALGFTAYSNALSGSFVWDDRSLVVENPQLRSYYPLGSLFTHSIAACNFSSYRPIQMLSYRIEHSMWGLNPMGYHAVNVLMHVGAALCLLWFLLELTGNRTAAVAAASLFIVHPVHSEAVTYIAGMADPLAAMFMFVSLAAYCRHVETGRKSMWIVSCTSMSAALLSKEYALITPALALVCHMILKKGIRWKPLASMAAVAALYLMWRQYIGLDPTQVDKNISSTLLERLPGAFAAIVQYIRVLLLPYRLHMGYGHERFSFLSLRVIAGVIVTAGLAAAAWKLRAKNQLLTFAIVWFFAGLIPVLNIFPINAYMAEHWLYVPSLGFFLILGVCYDRLRKEPKLRQWSLTGIIIITSTWSGLTIAQNRHWRDEIQLYQHVIACNPGYIEAYNNLGLVLVLEKRHDEAVRYLSAALELDPDYKMAHNNMGMALEARGQRAEAAVHYLRAIELDAEYPNPHYNLGIVLEVQGDRAGAISHYREALRLKPDYVFAHNNLGTLLARDGELDEGVGHYYEALKADPSYSVVHYNLSVYLPKMGNTEKGLYHCGQALRGDPENINALFQMGALLMSLEREKEAISYFNAVLARDRKHVGAHNNTGILMAKKADYEQAERHFLLALEADPSNSTALQNLAEVRRLMGKENL